MEENTLDVAEVIGYLKNVSFVLTTFILFIFPVFFLTNTTDFFVVPKQILIIVGTILLLVLWGIRILLEKRLTFISNPFNLPIVIFGVVVLVSSIAAYMGYSGLPFQLNYDSLMQSIPVIAVLFLYFLIINTYTAKGNFTVGLSALSGGAVLASIIAILYNFKIYVLPFPSIQTQYFNTFGSAIQFLLYVFPLLLLSVFYIRKNVKNVEKTTIALHAVGAIFMGLGILAVIYQIITLPQKPILLPYLHGFQIALASLSQDSQRLIGSFLLGSGYGTFLTDFSRFRSPIFNQNTVLWNVPFSYSSSYFLELIATTGVLGLLSYIFIIIKIVKTRVRRVNPLFITLLVTFGLSFFLPFAFSLVFLLFTLLGFYAAFLNIDGDKNVSEVILSLVALKNGLFTMQETDAHLQGRKTEGKLLPGIVLTIIIIFGAFIGYWTIQYIRSDMTFAESLSRDSLNSGQKAYTLQIQALQTYPFRSDYYRVYSQVNFALANSLSNSVPKGSKPSTQVQQTVLTLLQQSINSARAATTLAPLTDVNWENLGQVYRNLINVGQNADQFAIASMNQAIVLNPSNPLYYIELGGIYYQLGQYDLAANAFRQAVNLKPDFANAYYNLGHALQQKGDPQDLQTALQEYQTVQQLVQNNSASYKQITDEINALNKQISNQGNKTAAQNPASQTGGTAQNQPPLQVANPTPIQNTKLPGKLPGPPPPATTSSPAPSPTGTPAATPTPAQ